MKQLALLLRNLASTVTLALLTVGLTGCFEMSSDTEALRTSVMKSTGAAWDPEIVIGVGALPLTLARAGLAFVNLDPEPRAALNAARGADIGVYHLRDGHTGVDRAAMLAEADKAMTARHWDRVVGVVNQRELVAVYVPSDVHSTRDVKVCVVVLEGRKLVVASARSNLEPLLDLASNRWGQPASKWPTHLF